MDELMAALWGKDTAKGYAALKELLAVSRESDKVYGYMDVFLEKLASGNSYWRTRALALLAANAKWDRDCQIDENLDAILSHITDSKPVTARGFIRALPGLAADKPDLSQDILQALYHADVSHYPSSMRPLVEADIRKAIREIEG